MTTATQTSTRPRPGGAPQARYSFAALWPVAILTLGAAAIHFAVVPAELAEWLPFGIFFLLLGAAQVALAAATLLRPRAEPCSPALPLVLLRSSPSGSSRAPSGYPSAPIAGRPKS